MDSKFGVLVILLAAGVASPSYAAPMTYGCDTPADSFSAIEQQVQTKSFMIKGSIRPVQFRKGKYAPLAQVYLDSADGQSRFGIQILADAKSKNAIAFLNMTKNGKKSDPISISIVELSKELDFQISIFDGSKITYKVDHIEGNTVLPLGDRAQLNVICSTGEFIFSGLDWTD